MEITLKTKYSVGDVLWRYNAVISKLEEFKVSFVNVNAYSNKTDVFYFNESGSCSQEQYLFTSKQEFIDQL